MDAAKQQISSGFIPSGLNHFGLLIPSGFLPLLGFHHFGYPFWLYAILAVC